MRRIGALSWCTATERQQVWEALPSAELLAHDFGASHQGV